MTTRRQSKRVLGQEPEKVQEKVKVQKIGVQEANLEKAEEQRPTLTLTPEKSPVRVSPVQQQQRPTKVIPTLYALKSKKPDLYSSFLASCVDTLSQYGWLRTVSPESYAQELFRCLVLKASVSDPKSYSLPAKLDMGWHALLLETQDYIHLCQFITGTPDGMIHHSTRTANDSFDLKRWRNNNLEKLYTKVYGQPPNSWCWNKDAVVGNADASQRIDPPRNQKPNSDGIFYVKTGTGKVMTFRYQDTDTIALVKEKIFIREGILPDYQRLIYQGKQLDDDPRTLLDYNVLKGSTLEVFLRQRGC